jgi:SulP family sulfate permease
MPPRWLSASQLQLPFTGENVDDADFVGEQAASGSNTVTKSRRIRANSTASNTFLPGSYTHRTPARSFAYQASHSALDAPQYSSQGVRERTQELASYALESEAYQNRDRRPSLSESQTGSSKRTDFGFLDFDINESRASAESLTANGIQEEQDPESPETTVFRPRSDPFNAASPALGTSRLAGSPVSAVMVQDIEQYSSTEQTPLLPKARLSRIHSGQGKSAEVGISGRSSPASFRGQLGETFGAGRERLVDAGRSLLDPRHYTRNAVLANTSASLQTLSAVFLGLLLNILDALSYGYILFPLGTELFSSTGPDGISIFFVSCIVSQLCYSLGLSAFRGGVGSEMIEVVPFFHKMAYSILAKMEGQSDEAIIATVIVSYCLSSVITGLIFLALGVFKLGNLVNFFPRHILIGCIGGVGFFLIVTGIEVSARLEGNLNYDMETLHKLFAQDTIYLWLLPLVLSVIILVLRRLNKSPVVLPAFFILIFGVFYLIVKAILRLDLELLRQSGWIFERPEAGVPFYRFYSYFSRSGHSTYVCSLALTNPRIRISRRRRSAQLCTDDVCSFIFRYNSCTYQRTRPWRSSQGR